MSEVFTGGCQCGAVRFRAEKLGRPSICHCRMCQKQFGSVFAPLVTADQAHLTWTRGQPTLFRSSQKIKRGFCNTCGTPLTYQSEDGVELAIGAFDHPEKIEPEIQVNYGKRIPWIDHLFEKPKFSSPEYDAKWANIESWQHPDHDTDHWPPEDEA
ncbi:GFA family protein [Allorhizobium sp. BGMRC 0089]|uniref:GFA family protein n=1 Tax=Allorhizobium sonneratiae TaxID=2934936 RepID=UPI002033FAFE|nr:GFA family protein [Allorhizobium sonneratiae]MCM2292008.1 GFA family protein [Allorhizobium sonneratiae]